MQKRTFQKVTLARETLRVLDRAHWYQVVGGMTKTTCDTYSEGCTASANCQTFSCAILTACNC